MDSTIDYNKLQLLDEEEDLDQPYDFNWVKSLTRFKFKGGVWGKDYLAATTRLSFTYLVCHDVDTWGIADSEIEVNIPSPRTKREVLKLLEIFCEQENS